MVRNALLNLIKTRIFLNGASCCMGFFMWYCISNSLTITHTFAIPIYFDNVDQTQTIQAPATTQITLSGSRALLNSCRSWAALHFDGAQFSAGKRILRATYRNFLLPSAVKVVDCMPVEVTVTFNSATSNVVQTD